MCHYRTLFDGTKSSLSSYFLPRSLGGGDEFSNLIVVYEWIHILIHANHQPTIEQYKKLLNLTKIQIEKVNKYREKCNLTKIN